MEGGIVGERRTRDESARGRVCGARTRAARRVATSAAGGRSEQRVRLDPYGGEEEGDEGVECNFQRICT